MGLMTRSQCPDAMILSGAPGAGPPPRPLALGRQPRQRGGARRSRRGGVPGWLELRGFRGLGACFGLQPLPCRGGREGPGRRPLRV